MNEIRLHDILLPETSLWWPPAPGWWLALLSLILLALLAGWLIRRLRNPPLASLCLAELQAIRRARDAGQGDRATLAELGRLLRRVLISYGGRAQQAASTGSDWIRQLQQLAAHDFSEAQLDLLARERYRANPEGDIDGLLQACETWIRRLPRGGQRVSA